MGRSSAYAQVYQHLVKLGVWAASLSNQVQAASKLGDQAIQIGSGLKLVLIC